MKKTSLPNSIASASAAKASPVEIRAGWWSAIIQYARNPGWLLLPLLLVGFVLRYLCVDYALPYVYPWDEPEIINPAINVLRYGDYRPTRFAYGPMNGYVHAAWGALTFVRGIEKGEFPDSIWALTSNRDTAWYWSITSAYFLRQARVLTTLLGLVTVVFVFAAGKRLGGFAVGFWAASIMALSRTSIIQSSTVTADSTAMMTTAIVLWASTYILQSRARWAYWTAAIFCGLTMAFKYTSFPVVFFPLIAHLVTSCRCSGKIFDTGLFWFVLACGVSLALFLFPVFLQPTRFLHDLATESLYYGPAGSSKWSEYAVGVLRGFLVTVDGGSSSRLFIPTGMLVLVVLLCGSVVLFFRNKLLLLMLGLPALLNIHFVGQHASHFFGRNLLLSMEPFGIIGGFGFLWIAEKLESAVRRAKIGLPKSAIQGGVYIVCFLPLLIWGVRNAREQYTFVEPRVQLSQKMQTSLPTGTRVLVASETRWYMNRDELKHLRIADSPILRMMMDPPPTTVAEYLVLPREVTFYHPTPEKEEFGTIINKWLATTTPEPGFDFGMNRFYFGKPSSDPQVRLVKNTPELWKERLISTDKIYGTEFTAGSRNAETKLSDEGLAIRAGLFVTAAVHITKPMSKVTVNARGLSPFRQDVQPNLNLEVFPATSVYGKPIATTSFSLNRSQSGLLDYTNTLDLKPGDYLVRLRGSDPEDFRIEVAIVNFS